MMDGSRREIPVYMKAAQCKNISSTPGLRARVKNKLSSVYALVVHASSRSCSSAGNCARSTFGRCPCVLLIPPPVCSPLVPGSLHSLVLEQQRLLLRRFDRMGQQMSYPRDRLSPGQPWSAPGQRGSKASRDNAALPGRALVSLRHTGYHPAWPSLLRV